MVQYQLAVSIELAPLAIVIAGDHIHLFTPFPGGMRWVSPFPLTRRTQSRSLPAKNLLFENFSKIFFEVGLSSENSKRRPASRHWFVCRRKETAALKIKAAVSNGRVKLSALRRLFFFCRRPAEYYSIFNSMFPVKFSHSMPI